MEYFLLFTTGLFSSMHCIGMCGCFVTAYSVNLKGSNISKASSHLFYSLGRITTYTILGALMGLLGSTIFTVGNFIGIQTWIAVISGLVMIYLGLSLSNIFPTVKLFDKLSSFFIKYIQKYYGKLIKKQGVFFTYPIGLVLGLLPCCLLYTIEIKAMSTGNVLKGALSMFFFGLGTIPSLFSFGMLVNIVDNKMRNKLLNFAGYIIVFLGLNSIYRALYG